MKTPFVAHPKCIFYVLTYESTSMMKTLIRALLIAAVPVASSAQTTWDLPTGYAANTFHVQNLQQFADDVNKATAGKLKITLHPGGSLYKANEIKRAVQSGQVPAGEMILSGASNENSLFGVDSIPFIATSYADSKRLYLAAKPMQEKVLQAQGIKVLYSVPWPGQSLYSLKPVNTPADLAGTKMRAYNPATSRIAQLLKAQPVTIQLAELPQALATGAVQTFLSSSAGGIESKLYEQVKYFYPVSAWLPRNITVVSQKAFDALSPAVKEAVLKAAAAAEERGWVTSERLDAEYIKELGAKGMIISPVSDTVKKELEVVGATMTAEWLKISGPDGKQILDSYMKK
jgi:TRAP-type C4-dicarboxylate transport system substrate-binding protein